MVRGSITYEMKCKPTFNFVRDKHTTSATGTGVLFESVSSEGSDQSLFLDTTTKLNLIIG